MEVESKIFAKRLEHLLEKGDNETLKKSFEKENFRMSLIEHFWDATFSLATYINDENLASNAALVNTCSQILRYLAQESKPREFLIVLLEQLDTFKDDTKFLGLMECLAICLRQVDLKKSSWMYENSLNCLVTHLKIVPIPESKGLEEDELLLIHDHANTNRHLTLVNALLDFFDQIVDGRVRSDFPPATSEACLRCLIQLLEYPLTDIDFISELASGCNNSRVTARRCVQMMFHFIGCAHNFIVDASHHNDRELRRLARADKHLPDGDGDDDDDDENKSKTYSSIGILSFMYFIHADQSLTDTYPKVVSPWYNLQLCGKLILTHLPSSNLHCQRCALLLFQHLLKRIPTDTLTSEIWDAENCKDMVKLLTDIMTLGIVKEIRSLALDCFHLMLRASTCEAKYLVLVIIINSTKHSGVKGHVIKVLKDYVAETLAGRLFAEEVFLGSSLARLFRDFFVLPEGIESDLVQSADWIITSLNFLLFLVLADGADRSFAWRSIDKMERDFLDPIRKAVHLSRAHYEEERRNVTSDEKLLVEICGMSLPPMSKEEKQKVMDNAIVTLDLILCILCQVCDAVDARKKKEQRVSL